MDLVRDAGRSSGTSRRTSQTDHGPADRQAEGYSRAELKQWAQRIQELQAERDVYCIFTTDVNANAIENAVELKEMVQSALAGG